MKRRVQPLSRQQEIKLASTYGVLWYNGSNSYSEVFKLSDSIFRTYSPDARLRWGIGSTAMVADATNKKHLATFLAIGTIDRVQDFESSLSKVVDTAYDTETALAFAEKFDNGTPHQVGLDSESDTESSTNTAMNEEEEDSETSKENSEMEKILAAKRRREDKIDMEMQKMLTLSKVATSSTSTSALINQESTLAPPEAIEESNANKSTEFILVSKLDFAILTGQISELIKINKKTNHILSEIYQ